MQGVLCQSIVGFIIINLTEREKKVGTEKSQVKYWLTSRVQELVGGFSVLLDSSLLSRFKFRVRVSLICAKSTQHIITPYRRQKTISAA